MKKWFIGLFALLASITFMGCPQLLEYECKITYVTEHGTAPESITVLKYATLSEDQLKPLTAEGFDFTGWYNSDELVKAGYPVLRDITLTAGWKEIEKAPDNSADKEDENKEPETKDPETKEPETKDPESKEPETLSPLAGMWVNDTETYKIYFSGDEKKEFLLGDSILGSYYYFKGTYTETNGTLVLTSTQMSQDAENWGPLNEVPSFANRTSTYSLSEDSILTLNESYNLDMDMMGVSFPVTHTYKLKKSASKDIKITAAPPANGDPDDDNPADDPEIDPPASAEYDYFFDGKYRIKKEYLEDFNFTPTSIPTVTNSLPASVGDFPFPYDVELDLDKYTSIKFQKDGTAVFVNSSISSKQYKYSWNANTQTLYLQLYKDRGGFGGDDLTYEEYINQIKTEYVDKLSDMNDEFMKEKLPTEFLSSEEKFNELLTIFENYYKSLGKTDAEVKVLLDNLSYKDISNFYLTDGLCDIQSVIDLTYSSVEKYNYLNTFKWTEEKGVYTAINEYPTTIDVKNILSYGNLNTYSCLEGEFYIEITEGAFRVGIKTEQSLSVGATLILKYQDGLLYVPAHTGGIAKYPCIFTLENGKVVINLTMDGKEYKLTEPTEKEKLQFTYKVSGSADSGSSDSGASGSGSTAFPSDSDEVYGYDQVGKYKIRKNAPYLTEVVSVNKPEYTPVSLPPTQADFPFEGKTCNLNGDTYSFNNGTASYGDDNITRHKFSYSWDKDNQILMLLLTEKELSMYDENNILSKKWMTAQDVKNIVPNTVTEQECYKMFMEEIYPSIISSEDCFKEEMVDQGIVPYLKSIHNDYYSEEILNNYLATLSYESIWEVVKYLETVYPGNPYLLENRVKNLEAEWFLLEEYYHVSYYKYSKEDDTEKLTPVLPENYDVRYLLSTLNDIEYVFENKNSGKQISIKNGQMLTPYNVKHTSDGGTIISIIRICNYIDNGPNSREIRINSSENGFVDLSVTTEKDTKGNTYIYGIFYNNEYYVLVK